MRNRIIRFHVTALLVLTGVMFTWGCGGEQKKAEPVAKGGIPAAVLAVRPAEAFTAPAAPAMANNEIIAYAKVRDLQKFLDRLGNWSSLFPVPMTPEMLRVQLEQSGVNLSELREGGNITLFMFNPGPVFANVPMAGLVPAADGGSIAQTMRAQMGPDNIQAMGDSLLFAQDVDSLTRAQALGDTLGETASAAMTSDIQLYLNMETIMNQYGAMARGYIPMFKKMLAMAPGMPPAQLAQTQQNVETMMVAMLDFLDQVQGVTLLVDMGAENLEIATVVTAKPDTALVGMFNAEPIAAPDLARFLPTDNVFRGQMTYTDLKGMMDWWLTLMAKTLPPDSGVDFTKLEEEFAGIAQIGRTDYAIGFGMQNEGSLSIQGILSMEDSAPMMKLIEEKMASFNEGVIHDFYQATGMDMSVEETPSSRQIAGYPVHQYKISVNFQPEMAATPEQAEMMKKLLGDMQMEVVDINPLVVYSINTPSDALVQSLLDAAAGTSLSAAKSYPAGGIFEGDMNFASYMNAIQMIVPEMQATGMPTLPADLPPMMMYARNTNGDGYYSMKIPRGLVKGLVDAVTGVAQMPPVTTPAEPAVAEPDMAPVN